MDFETAAVSRIEKDDILDVWTDAFSLEPYAAGIVEGTDATREMLSFQFLAVSSLPTADFWGIREAGKLSSVAVVADADDSFPVLRLAKPFLKTSRRFGLLTMFSLWRAESAKGKNGEMAVELVIFGTRRDVIGKGRGTSLLHGLFQEYGSRGKREMILQTRADGQARGLYEREGFEVFARKKAGPFDMVWMRRDISREK